MRRIRQEHLILNMAIQQITALALYCCFAYFAGAQPGGFPPPSPPIRQCEFGSALNRRTGRPIVCSPFTTPQNNQCPSGTFCRGGPADEPGLCCLRNDLVCGRQSNPLTSMGNAPTCLGPERINCPRGFRCRSIRQPLSAVCCSVSVGPQCPPGVPIVNCFVDPCQVTSCRAFPRARCVSDYCGGCNARFYIGRFEVTRFCSFFGRIGR